MSVPQHKVVSSSADITQMNAKERFLAVASKLTGLVDVEKVIQSKLHSDAQQLEEIPRYLLSLGGKRIRPILTLLVYQLFQKSDCKDLFDVAAGIELIHMATLLHDDIIDRSALRRHKASPFVTYGLPGTLLAGDFLLVRAFALCAHLDTFIIDATEKACVELTEGEILETSLQTTAHTIASSLQIAQKKTASLFRLSCESAAFLAGLPKEQITYLAQYGENLGIAFQIVDDILDIVSNEAELGKKPGTDIKERKPSMVNVLWLESGDEKARQVLTDPTHGELSDHQLAALVAKLQTNPLLDKARDQARAFVAKAERALEEIVRTHQELDQPTLMALRSLTQYAIERME
jgi:geranylgeranyl pyrophosphate synthase